MKRNLINVLVLCSTIGILTSCSFGTANNSSNSSITQESSPLSGEVASSSVSEAPKEFVASLDTTKTVELICEGGWDNFEALDQVEADFQKYYPNVSISYSKNKNLTNSMVNNAEEGTLDLIFNTATAAAWSEGESGAIYKENLLELSATEFNLSGINKNALKCGQLDGVQYGVHMYEDMYGIIVNEDLLKQNGFEVPTSYTELTAICDAFAKKAEDERAILMYGPERSRVVLPFIYENIVKNKDKEGFISNLNDGIATEELFSNAVEIFREWTSKGYFNSACNTVEDNYNKSIIEFFNGKVPFLFGSVGTFSGTKKREAETVSTYSEHPFKYSFIVTPTSDIENTTCISITTGMFGICKASKNLDYAKEFLKFLLREENMNTMSSVKRMPSTNLNVVNESFANLSKLNQNNLHNIASLGLSSTSYQKLRDTANLIRKEETTVESLVTTYKEKIEATKK